MADDNQQKKDDKKKKEEEEISAGGVELTHHNESAHNHYGPLPTLGEPAESEMVGILPTDKPKKKDKK